ncbi:MAG: hypothetical protein IPK15_22370 [Verrucomicrobia bacterium]|jgi:beta-lactamase regulating signal transducer with metallopeptidase domain|nr:hypothetical protein [Verrucomicrobiota bacterium]
MNIGESMVIWIVGLVIAALLVQLGRHYFSEDIRERRRRRNHRKVISRARRPVVMLSAKVPKN